MSINTGHVTRCAAKSLAVCAHQQPIRRGVGGAQLGRSLSASPESGAPEALWIWMWSMTFFTCHLLPDSHVSLCLMKQTWNKTAAWEAFQDHLVHFKSLQTTERNLWPVPPDTLQSGPIAGTHKNTQKPFESIASCVAHRRILCFKVCSTRLRRASDWVQCRVPLFLPLIPRNNIWVGLFTFVLLTFSWVKCDCWLNLTD